MTTLLIYITVMCWSWPFLHYYC